jgi:hypothetical protein
VQFYTALDTLASSARSDDHANAEPNHRTRKVMRAVTAPHSERFRWVDAMLDKRVLIAFSIRMTSTRCCLEGWAMGPEPLAKVRHDLRLILVLMVDRFSAFSSWRWRSLVSRIV